MENCADEELEFVYRCQLCQERAFRRPHHLKKYWLITFIVHTTLLIVVLSVVTHFRKGISDHDIELHTFLSALHVRRPYKIEYASANDWDPELFFGEPNYESDSAWESLIFPRSLRLHRSEAADLNLTDSMRVQPGADFGVELGVIHHLHCLRQMHQEMFPAYYFPDTPDDQMKKLRHHTRHCLEVLRKAVICNPDLTPYSYFMTGGENSHISVSPVVTRQCVDWDYLQQFLAPRRVKGRDLMLNTGPSS